MNTKLQIVIILAAHAFAGCAYNQAMEHERIAHTNMAQEMRVVSAENSSLRSERSRLQSQLSRVRSSLADVEKRLSRATPGTSNHATLQKELQSLTRKKAELMSEIDALS